MKLKEGFDSILDDNDLSDFNAYIIGVAYEDNDTFLFVNLTIDDEEIENNTLYYHACYKWKNSKFRRRRGFLQRREH